MNADDPHGLDMPYEDSPAGGALTPQDLAVAQLASGCVLLALSIDLPAGGKAPAVGFRFAKPDGSGFMPLVVLVLEPERMENLPALLRSTVTGALRAAR